MNFNSKYNWPPKGRGRARKNPKSRKNGMAVSGGYYQNAVSCSVQIRFKLLKIFLYLERQGRLINLVYWKFPVVAGGIFALTEMTSFPFVGVVLNPGCWLCAHGNSHVVAHVERNQEPGLELRNKPTVPYKIQIR